MADLIRFPSPAVVPPFPARRYEIIYADPPWPYYGDPNKDQAAGKHYALMSVEAIKALPVQEIRAQPAVLFLWATSPKLAEALEVMEAWGFHFRGVAYVWVKTTRDGRIISGQGIRPTFTKPTSEFVLIGSTNARGRTFPLLTEAQGQVVPAPRGRHSEKPPAVRERIVELLGDRARIELFARARVSGWDAWGNEIDERGLAAPAAGSDGAAA